MATCASTSDGGTDGLSTRVVCYSEGKVTYCACRETEGGSRGRQDQFKRAKRYCVTDPGIERFGVLY
eukprot:8022347-Pyramimonas_sp.AAC.1